MPRYDAHKLLIANRGEIAVRIIKTAKKIGLRTVAIYSPSDALSPHVSLADEVALLDSSTGPTDPSKGSESELYRSISSIIAICQKYGVTLLHPGYGFLSENASFAELVLAAGVTWIGPQPQLIRIMGMKHEARRLALNAGLEIAPGSESLLRSEEDAVDIAKDIGYPVMLKATAGGGGMGIVVCKSEEDLKQKFSATQLRARALFGDEGLLMERYFPAARHIEVQVFGNGKGEVVHLSVRECSVQRRYQKIIEESPSPFLMSHSGLSEKICEAALNLCRSIKYASAGTVEFLVDDETAKFYFLEMNTRIQVEHPVTEVIHPGVDIVFLMIKQGVSERDYEGGIFAEDYEMQQDTYDSLRIEGEDGHIIHAIEGRVYAENPSENFRPCSGLLQFVDFGQERPDWLRVESWISTGTTITPFFDPLLAKIIVSGRSREEALARFRQALLDCKIRGPPNNLEYLKAIADSEQFITGKVTTTFLDSFDFTPCAVKILRRGIDATIQDLPGRTIGLGVPRSGPMDPMAFSAGNILVGNPETTEAIEIIVAPGVGFAVQFLVSAVVAVTGKDVTVTVNGTTEETWSRIVVPAGGKLELQAKPVSEAVNGFRVYLVIRGGFPDVPHYLGSKSTSMGLGGYQGRSLLPLDQLALNLCGPKSADNERLVLPKSLVPVYPSKWVIYVLCGPHDDEEFVTEEGIERFYSTQWQVSPSSNRMGIRLDSPSKIEWARKDGGQGGSHPSNILDNGYAFGTININGDTPVILTNEGPDMGGYLCLCTIATADMWKVGQLNPGNKIQFKRVPWEATNRLRNHYSAWLSALKGFVDGASFEHVQLYHIKDEDSSYSPVLYRRTLDETRVVFRQAGDSAILVEFDQMNLDLFTRARMHAFEALVKEKNIPGLKSLCPCIRSVLCTFDPIVTSQQDVMQHLIDVEATTPTSVSNMEFKGRKITFPIVLDDSWNREALERYMSTTRNKAVYLPSNIDYLAANNGLEGPKDALQKLIASDWLVLGIGFYLACPFLVPIDPRCRLVGQKMNPSRTYTPRGAIGIAGPVAAIYPIESPGGYQLYGRTLPTWNTWGKGKDFATDRPWLLQPFDQIHFEPVTEAEYIQLERAFDTGQYSFKIEPSVFRLTEYTVFLDNIAEELAVFRQRQDKCSAQQAAMERALLEEWGAESNKASNGSEEAGDVSHDGATTITASIFASIWKIKCNRGDVIQSPEDVLLVLEAMKTEIPVHAGLENVGKTIQGFGKGIKEQAVVSPGDVLLLLSGDR